jgi:putative membrane protein
VIVRDYLPFQRIWPNVAQRLSLLFLFDLTVALLYSSADWRFLAMPGLPLATMGSAIGIFLAFRTNSAYERWWEARILWGGLVNASHTYARQILTMVEAKKGEDVPTLLQRKLMALHVAFVTAFRCHLRKQSPFPELKAQLGALATEELRDFANVPAAILLESGRTLQRAKAEDRLNDFRWMRLDQTLTELTNILGACERIKNTPLPRQYDFFPKLLVTAYCILLPFGLVEGMRYMTPLASTVVSFIFIALDTVGREIEAPFENTVHDTPMTSLSRSIEINIRQQFEERIEQRPVLPVDGFLY